MACTYKESWFGQKGLTIDGTVILFNFSMEVTSPISLGPDLLHGKRVSGVQVCMYKKGWIDWKGLTIFNNQISFWYSMHTTHTTLHLAHHSTPCHTLVHHAHHGTPCTPRHTMTHYNIPHTPCTPRYTLHTTAHHNTPHTPCGVAHHSMVYISVKSHSKVM